MEKSIRELEADIAQKQAEIREKKRGRASFARLIMAIGVVAYDQIKDIDIHTETNTVYVDLVSGEQYKVRHGFVESVNGGILTSDSKAKEFELAIDKIRYGR